MNDFSLISGLLARFAAALVTTPSFVFVKLLQVHALLKACPYAETSLATDRCGGWPSFQLVTSSRLSAIYLVCIQLFLSLLSAEMPVCSVVMERHVSHSAAQHASYLPAVT